MASSYPVKPRKTPKWSSSAGPQPYVMEDEELDADFGLDETLELFRVIEKVLVKRFEYSESNNVAWRHVFGRRDQRFLKQNVFVNAWKSVTKP